MELFSLILHEKENPILVPIQNLSFYKDSMNVLSFGLSFFSFEAKGRKYMSSHLGIF